MKEENKTVKWTTYLDFQECSTVCDLLFLFIYIFMLYVAINLIYYLLDSWIHHIKAGSYL